MHDSDVLHKDIDLIRFRIHKFDNILPYPDVDPGSTRSNYEKKKLLMPSLFAVFCWRPTFPLIRFASLAPNLLDALYIYSTFLLKIVVVDITVGRYIFLCLFSLAHGGCYEF